MKNLISQDYILGMHFLNWSIIVIQSSLGFEYKDWILTDIKFRMSAGIKLWKPVLEALENVRVQPTFEILMC